MSQSSESNIERLRKRLNSNRQPASSRREGQLSASDTSSIRRRFDHDDPPEDLSRRPVEEEEDGSFLNKLLGWSALFFILAFGFAVFSVGLGGSGVSPDKVAIEVDGPASVSAGETADFTISVTNRNTVALEAAELIIIYPGGTRQPSNTGESLRRSRETLGSIASDETIERTAEASLFGEQGEKKQLSFRLEYQVADSNAIFSVSDSYDIEVSESPLSLVIEAPGQVTTGEPFSLKVTVSSNATRSLSDVLLVARYPFGFVPQSVDPEASYRQYVWQLGDISPGAEREIEITGAFSDSNATAEQSFGFEAGTARVGDATEIGTLFASQATIVNLEEPFISVGVDLNISQDTRRDRLEIDGDLQWQSNLNTTARGGEITARLSGPGIDYSSISSNDGLYQSDQRALTWNSRTNSQLATISPGDSGEFRFQFATIDSQTLVEGNENPVVNLSISMQAQTPDSSSLPNPVTASLERTIKLPSIIELTADTLHEDGPFSNTGPTPPEVDERTTYTLHLSVSNTTNRITGAQFQAALPAYVEIAGNPAPSSSDFSYNEVSGRVTWRLGEITVGAGYTGAHQEIFIPVEITPNQNQVGQVLPLLEDLSITGQDSFTEAAVQITDIDPPTTVPDDLRSSGASGQVKR